jgi:hypothetical protein
MPDLIIKPTATSGNKLILQDQAGGAVLTTADSGATIANATLTAPTIANMANCTFPAGHMEYITSVTGDGSAVNIDFPYDGGHFSGSYSYFKIIGTGIRATSNDTHLYVRLGDSTGIQTSSNYTRAGYLTTHDSGSVGNGAGTAGGEIFFFNGASSDVDKTVSLEIDIYNAQSTSECKVLYLKAGGGRQNNANSLHGGSIWAYWNNSSTALTGLRVFGNQGNLHGTLKLYGII